MARGGGTTWRRLVAASTAALSSSRLSYLPLHQTSTMSPILVAMGNPLLDMQVVNGESLLQKYNLKANDAVLAEGNQSDM